MSAIRILVWAVHVALPAIGLWVLVANPHLDHEYMHQGVHFWLILGAALLSLALGVLLLRAARTHRDMRLILVSLVFQLNAGFLALHALATPGVILPSANVGFTTAVPVGMVLGGFAALASAVEYGPTARIHKYTGVLAALPITVMSAWALLSLTRVPPFDAVPDPSEVQGPLEAAAFLGAACYVAAAIRYAYLYLRNRGTVVLSVLTAFLLLAEALFAVGFGRSWRVSWWEWHVLLGLAFALIAVSAHRTFRKEGSVRGLFDSVTLRSTVAAMERDYASALEEMMTALSQRAAGGVPADEPLGAVGQRLSRRFGLTERQLAVLQQSARALGNEREQVRRLGALVAVGERASVIRGERQLVTEIQRLAGYAFEHDTVRIGMLSGGRLIFEDGGHPNPAAFAFPLTVKGIHTGVLELTRANGSGTAGSGTTGTTTSVGATAVPHPPAGSANPPGPVTAAHRSLGVDGPREGPALPTAPARTVPAPGVAPGPGNSPGLGTARPVPGPGGGRARRGFGWRPATSAEEGGSGFHTERPPAGPEGGASVLAVYHEYGAAGLGPAEQAVARSFAAQTSVVLENARLCQQLDGLFRSYMSPAVATALLADPSQAGLGGEVHEVSVLMADLRGYTPFAEKAGPVQVMRMLNTYYGAIVPEILAEGGTVVQFVGDAVMAIFNAPVRQRDHAVRAARAGLALQRATAAVRERAGAHGVEWPMFRVGVNTGPAIVGNVGAREMRNFTAIGDTTNLAARLEGLAEPGTVVVGPVTRERLGARADTECLGDFDIKGKSLPVTVYRLVALR
ncbi:adenylate/guanylate cyclase domain-containing protein [Nocardia huaxiensis]|uniref:Adenylate/guanylate cyclase domain-containing protein n=1 Tax=Nocardia huaxiensis TaxID=2755382 RepID=A0A7D6ZDL6_9NOCA|nr:adenylate/guanylate cyclase domain-containing protein [Nocardia huaxiensis]QLY31198.1 adenylate/guanylate cyclase domain-containing protein [Nocardia huaxiensis]